MHVLLGTGLSKLSTTGIFFQTVWLSLAQPGAPEFSEAYAESDITGLALFYACDPIRFAIGILWASARRDCHEESHGCSR